MNVLLIDAMEYKKSRFVENWRSFYREETVTLVHGNDALRFAQPAGKA
jgi:hypothetical protein